MRLKLCCKELHKSRKKILLPLRYWKNLWNLLTYLPRLETRGKTTSNHVYDFSPALNVTSNAGSSWGTEIDWIAAGTMPHVPLRVLRAGLCSAVSPPRARRLQCQQHLFRGFRSPGCPAGSLCCSRGAQRGRAGPTETTQGQRSCHKNGQLSLLTNPSE